MFLYCAATTDCMGKKPIPLPPYSACNFLRNSSVILSDSINESPKYAMRTFLWSVLVVDNLAKNVLSASVWLLP